MNTDQKLNALSKAFEKSINDLEFQTQSLKEMIDLRDILIKKLTGRVEKLEEQVALEMIAKIRGMKHD